MAIFLVWAAIVLFGLFLIGVWAAICVVLRRVLTPRVFISYRRRDRPLVAGGIRRALQAEYGASNVFFDEEMEEGKPYPKILNGWLQNSEVVVIVVGPDWGGAHPSGRPRVLSISDWVHHEGHYATEILRNAILVLAKGPDDDGFQPVPDYTDKYKDWGLSEEERESLRWIETLHVQSGLEVSVSRAGDLTGVEGLVSRIAARRRGLGRLPAIWMYAGLLLVTAVIGLSAWTVPKVATDAAAVHPLAERVTETTEERKKATEELKEETKKATDKLAERADKTQETLYNLDGVYINTLSLDQFIEKVRDDNAPGGDLKRYLYQYVCWHVQLASQETNPGGNGRYLVSLKPIDRLPNGVTTFTIRADFDAAEFVQHVKGKKFGALLYVSGRIKNISANEVLLEKCRLAVGRATEAPRKP